MANSGRQRLAGAVRHDGGPPGFKDAAGDHEVIVVVQRTGADAETAARALSFAAERLYRRAIALQRRTIDTRGASLSVLL